MSSVLCFHAMLLEIETHIIVAVRCVVLTSSRVPL